MFVAVCEGSGGAARSRRALLTALDNVEALLTFYRAVFGWRLPPQQLLQWGAEVPARVAQALGPTDLSAFDRASD